MGKIKVLFCRVSEITMKRLKSFWLFPDLIFYNLPIGREYKHCLKILHGFTDKVGFI